MKRYGKSTLMREIAKRFPGKVVHVTPETLPKRQRDPMFGIIVLDECDLESQPDRVTRLAETAQTGEE